MGEGGRGAGDPERGEGASSSSAPDAGDVGDWADEFEGTRLALVDPALLLAGLASRLSPLTPSSAARAPADARGLSVVLLEPDPGILDLIEPRKDFEEPCVSDLVKDGYDCSVSDGLFKFVVDPFFGVLFPLLLC